MHSSLQIILLRWLRLKYFVKNCWIQQFHHRISVDTPDPTYRKNQMCRTVQWCSTQSTTLLYFFGQVVLQPRACLMLGHATHTHDMLPNELPLPPAASLRRCLAALAPSVHYSCCKSSRSFTKAAASFFSSPPPPTRSYFGPSSFPKRETTILAQLCGHRDSYLAPFPMPPSLQVDRFRLQTQILGSSMDISTLDSWKFEKQRFRKHVSKPLLAKQGLRNMYCLDFTFIDSIHLCLSHFPFIYQFYSTVTTYVLKSG